MSKDLIFMYLQQLLGSYGKEPKKHQHVLFAYIFMYKRIGKTFIYGNL